MNKVKISELLEDLSVAEQIELVQDIWDNIAESSELPDLTDDERIELDRRSKVLRENPNSGTPWEDVKARNKL
jgi:putative addiction module component (TIGR02574 family)